MTDIDILMASDISLSIAREDGLLNRAGFTDAGELHRFLSTWGRAIGTMPNAQLPRNAVFLVDASGPANTNASEAGVRTLIAMIGAAQAKNKILICGLNGVASAQLDIPGAVSSRFQAGMWTHQLASQVSHSEPTRCFCYTANRAMSVFVAGVEVIGYDDVVTRTPSSSFDLVHRDNWGDGELLERCAQEKLQDRSRRGVWEDADLLLLRNSPEELIESMLEEYFGTKLRGYQRIERQNLVPNEGRVDILVTIADGRQYLVEIKWLGRSLKKDIDASDKNVKTELQRKWANSHVFVLNEDAAHAGVIQMGYYHDKLHPTKCYLVAYDCRDVGQQMGSECLKDYPKCPSLADHQYKIYHVGVDPRPASVKAKAVVATAKAAAKAANRSTGTASPAAKPGSGHPKPKLPGK
jgi:hypothetical protein